MNAGQSFFAGLAETAAMDRWCTPSVLPSVASALGSVDTEVSISVPRFGSHLDGSGLLGEVAARAAARRGAGAALVSANGSTGSNHAVMRYLAVTRPGRPVLIPRNAHHSVLNAAHMFGIRVVYLEQTWWGRFDAHRQPSVEAVTSALARYPEAAAVLVTSPSYEGLLADVSGISTMTQTFSEALVWVDQAWGSHLGWSDTTPRSALHLGADIVVESTHKTGGAIQQAGLLMWNQQRVDSDSMVEAYRELSTTSPQFAVFAAIDAALESLSNDPAPIEHAVGTAVELRARLCELVGPANVLSAEKDWIDPLKVVLCVAGTGHSGAAIASMLADEGIAVEKSSSVAITLIPTFQLQSGASDRLLNALRRLSLSPAEEGAVSDLPPWTGLPDEPEIVAAGHPTEIVPITEAVGRVAAEMVECYPPGIPVIDHGFRVTKAAVGFLGDAAGNGGNVVARDPSLSTLRVLSSV